MLAVGFDFDHTLGIDNKLELTVALDMSEALARDRGIPFDRVSAQPVAEEAVAAFRRGEVPVETALEGLFLRLAGDDEQNIVAASRYRDEALARAPAFVQPLTGLHEMLAALDKAGIKYAVLTNGWSPLQEEKARLVDIEAPVLVSERIGFSKPAREAFEALARSLEQPLEHLWYVGDDPRSDCWGARNAGMTAVWCDWENRTYPPDLEAPNYTIHALAELPQLLQGQASGASKPP